MPVLSASICPMEELGVYTQASEHQCRMGFWPRLFLLFCLGFRTEAYWGEAKSRSSTTAVGRTPLWYHPSRSGIRKWRCSEPAAAANQRRQRPSGGTDPAATKWRCSEPAAAAAPTQRRGNGGAANQRLQRHRPSGSNDPAARKWRCSEPAAAANQRRQRPSGGNDPAAATNQRTIDGGGVGCREREERHGDCGGEGEKEKKGWLGCREREERNGVV
ncbi:hypothetical protein DEO72_LG3g206 [Vigna unguiculata]|uniref:Uncharacterized protein n=1 Tax=Vigna unguiculata TaxID=3917 RepID=A0A4D6LBB4_VIGUN|nr:hypothetical protein DEO72_LG3g206 [Vigna unguiculata]